MRVWICVDCKVSEEMQGRLQVLANKRIPVGLMSIFFRVCKEDVDKWGQNSVSSRLMHCSAWSTIIGVHRPFVFILQQWMSAPSAPTPTSSSLLHSKWTFTVSYYGSLRALSLHCVTCRLGFACRIHGSPCCVCQIMAAVFVLFSVVVNFVRV